MSLIINLYRFLIYKMNDGRFTVPLEFVIFGAVVT